MNPQVAFDDEEDRGDVVCWCGGSEDEPCRIEAHESRAYARGAAVVFGIIGMFSAIREAETYRRLVAVVGNLDEQCSACSAPEGEPCKPGCPANSVDLSWHPELDDEDT